MDANELFYKQKLSLCEGLGLSLRMRKDEGRSEVGIEGGWARSPNPHRLPSAPEAQSHRLGALRSLGLSSGTPEGPGHQESPD